MTPEKKKNVLMNIVRPGCPQSPSAFSDLVLAFQRLFVSPMWLLNDTTHQDEKKKKFYGPTMVERGITDKKIHKKTFNYMCVCAVCMLRYFRIMLNALLGGLQ